jgi:hypothetical protein
VELALDDFDRISSRTPLLADMKPWGRYVAHDVYRAGGIGVIAKRLAEAGLLHEDALTVGVPVIAVPTSIGYGVGHGGLAALLGMLNSCAANVVVVNIDNGFGAGVVASLINRLPTKTH